MTTLIREALLHLGEDQSREFKSSLSLTKEAFIALCAMVNSETARGLVVFGVDSTGAISGLGDTNLDSAQRSLAHHAEQKVDPPLTIQIEAHTCEGLPVLVLSGRRPKSVPFHEYDGRAYIREGSTNRQLSLTDKKHLMKARDRDLHNGPWVCDKCRSWVGVLAGIEITDAGPRKSYHCGCGGEFWPAT